MKNLPINIDLSASANLNVSAEIPSLSMGNVVDAITDVFRPFTESRGLRADQIRLQREDILFEIAQKARARAQLEQVDLQPVPLKLLAPFLEKASIEDADIAMREKWASLLLSASKNYNSHHLTFLDILSRLSSHEITILEEVAFSFDRFPETEYSYIPRIVKYSEADHENEI